MGRTEPERNEEVNSKSLFESSLTLEEEQNNVGNSAFLTSFSFFYYFIFNLLCCTSRLFPDYLGLYRAYVLWISVACREQKSTAL